MDYRFRISKAEEDNFVCEIAICGDQTFQQFHNILVKELNFDGSLMASFFSLDKSGDRKQEIALMEMFSDDDQSGEEPLVMDVVNIMEVVNADDCELEYVYDIFNDKFLKIEYLGEYFGGDDTIELPICLICEGELPVQTGFDFSEDWEEDFLGDNNGDSLDDSFLNEFGGDDELEDLFSNEDGYSGHENLDDYLDRL